MNQEQKYNIEDFTNKLIKFLDLNVPIDLDHLIKKLNGTTKTEDLGYYNMFKTVLTKTSDDSFCIYVSDELSDLEKQKRISIAYSLGNLLLHTGYLTSNKALNELNNLRISPFYFYNSWPDLPTGQIDNVSDKEHKESIYFAKCLLLPEKEFRKAIKKFLKDDKVNTLTLAKHFNVSAELIICRGEDLGIFENYAHLSNKVCTMNYNNF